MRTNIAAFCVIGLTLLVSIEYSLANPTGGSVVGGGANATITGQGTALTTINQSANQVIINWQNFSIGAGELTRFVQPSATAAALNRVISGNPSQIYGSLQANGRVFVINPNGILVGPSGQIDTKGFVASTLDVPDSSFLSGASLILSGNSTASVRNQGSIQALGGDVYLIAHSVENDGAINAPQGTVGLAAGSQVQLVQSGNEHLSVLAGNSAAPTTAIGVNNSGTIQAASAELKAAGGNIYALAINNGGIVRATGIVNKGGHIYLSAAGGNIQNSGTLSANNADGSGGTVILDGGHNATVPSTVINSGTIEARGDAAGSKGGTVEILGDHVGLFENAVVDVSGDGGGGTALVGGDYRGANPNVQNAEAIYVGPDAEVRADALSFGNGGKVVLWSDDITRFYGTIFARGGLLGGNGGFVETSSGDSLSFGGLVSTLAPAGIGGSLLLDPKNIFITLAGVDIVANNETFSQNDTADASLSAANVITELANNASLTLQANNDIAIETDLNFAGNASTAGKDFTLQAGRNIILASAPDFTTPANSSGAVTMTMNGGNFAATYNDAGAEIANRDAGTAQFVMSSGSSIITEGGGISITGGTLSGAAGDTLLGALTTSGPANTPGTAGGGVTVNTGAGGGNITVAGTITTAGAALTSGAVAGNDGGNVNLTGANVTVAGINTSGSNGRGVGNHGGGDAGSITIDATGGTPTITLEGNLTATGGDSTGNATVTAGNGGAVTLMDPVTLGANVIVDAQRGAGTAVQTSGNVWFQGAVNADSAANNRTLTINTGGTTEFDSAVGSVQSLLSLTTDNAGDAGEVTQLGSDVTTTGSQTYNDAVVQSGNVHLTGTALNVGPSWDAQSHNLQLSFSSGVTVPGVFANVNNFISDGTGGTTLNGNFTTTGSQTYNNAVTLGASGALNGTTLDLGGVTGNNHNLTLGNSGMATLGGSVIGVNQLTASGTGTLAVNNTISAASVNDSEATTLSGSSVTTTGGQTYNNPVTLGNNVTLSSTGNGAVALNSTVDADNALNNRTLGVNTGGTATFGNSVGALNPLGGLAVNGGTISLNGAVTVNNLGTVSLVSPGNITIDFGITAGTLTVHSGTDGSGNISFGNPGIIIDANTQSYQAGDGTGDGSTATADLVHNAPVFNNYAASGAPASFTFRQDASITAGEVPLIVPTTAYTIESDDGSVQLPGLNLPGNLDVTANGPITQTGTGLQVGGTATFAAGTANDITLDNVANNFNNVVVTSGNNVTFHDVNSITFGPLVSTITGNFTVVAGGDLFGSYIVGGAVSITVGGQNNGSLSSSLADLSQVEIPVPRLESTAFSTASMSLDQATKILPPGSIGTLWLQIPFPGVKEENYRVEDISKWTSGPIAAMGSTSGPQMPK